MRLFLSSLRKLARRPVAWALLALILFQLLAGVLIGATTAPGTPGMAGQARAFLDYPGAYDRLLVFILRFGGLYAAILGAAIAGSEWGWGTLKTAFARGESRTGFVTLTFAGVAVAIGIGLVVALGIAVAASLSAAALSGLSTSGATDSAALGELPGRLARGWLVLVEEGAVGYAIAIVGRNQLAGIGAAIALFLGESLFGAFLPDVVKYLPFDAGNAAVAGAGGGNVTLGGGAGAAALASGQALMMVGLWLVAAIVVMAVVTERAEVAG
jgi:ABC-2 type transport system permease protein